MKKKDKLKPPYAKWKRFKGGQDWKSVSCLERKFKPKTKKLFLFWRNTAILAAAPLYAATAAAATNYFRPR